jgi:hypothetical protein
MTLSSRAVMVFFLCYAGLAGCASAPGPGQVRLEGVLVHRVPPPGVQSVEAYLGERFVLEVSGGETVLLPTDTVPVAALQALVGRRVRVEGTRAAGRPPQVGVAAPLGPDGQPMAQGAGVQVGRLEAVATEP